MKVVHVIVGLNVGGAEMMLKKIIMHTPSKENVEHIVVSLTDVGEVGEDLKKQGVKIYALNARKSIGIFMVCFKLMSVLKKESPDLVQTWMYHADLLGGLAARLLRVPVVWNIRTTDIKKSSGQMTVVIRWLCSVLSKIIPHKIICVAKSAEQVHVRVGYSEKKIQVIGNGFPIPAIGDATRKLAGYKYFNASDFIIGSVGRYSAAKNHMLLLRAASIVVKTVPYAKFIMIGRDVDENNLILTRAIDSLNLKDNVILLGPQSNVQAHMRYFDLFCLHSRTEGFPNVLGEAMALGIPSITTDVGDARIVIGDSELVIPPDDEMELAQKIIKMASLSSTRLVEIGINGRNRIVELFSIEKIVSQYLALYQEVLRS
ncbi:glycosyltransferase [Kerstersia gyiorum]|uniref:glycosyltransferase n=1 Tax=Kerstersia gyiorum TaxID=206506 RepID=UPI0039EBD500